MTHSDAADVSPTSVDLSSKYAALLFWKEIEPEGPSGVYEGEYIEPTFQYSEAALSAIENIESLQVSIEQEATDNPRTLFRVSATCEIWDFEENGAPFSTTDVAHLSFLLQKALHRSHWQMVQDQLEPKDHGWSRPYKGPVAWDEVTPSNEDIDLSSVQPGDHYDWWKDERPFWDRYEGDKSFDKFQTLTPFRHWDDMVIYLSYVSGVDGALGDWITKELWLYETHEKFKEVKFQLISPEKYVDRLSKQFSENFDAPSV